MESIRGLCYLLTASGFFSKVCVMLENCIFQFPRHCSYCRKDFQMLLAVDVDEMCPMSHFNGAKTNFTKRSTLRDF